MFCVNCGIQAKGDFCHGCGEKITLTCNKSVL